MTDFAIQLIMAVVLMTTCALAAIFPQAHTVKECPAGYDLRTGVRRDGSFECWPHPVGDLDWDGTWHRPERSTQPSGVLEDRIHCTGGSSPIVVDSRTVGCQR